MNGAIAVLVLVTADLHLQRQQSVVPAMQQVLQFRQPQPVQRPAAALYLLPRAEP